MSTFEYEAINFDGERVTGIIDGDNQKSVRKDLRKRNLVPLKLFIVNKGLIRNKFSNLFPETKISSKDLSILTRQLAAMLDAGAPLEESIYSIIINTKNKEVKTVLSSVRSGVLEGMPFAEALKNQGKNFSTFYYSLVSVGEMAGSLPLVLDRLANYLEKNERFKSKIISASIYPFVLALTAISIVITLMAFVVPKIAAQFDSIGGQLPTLTIIIMNISYFIIEYGLFFLIILFFLIVIFIRLIKFKKIRKLIDEIILKLPVVGIFIKNVYSARLSRTLSTLISCGSPIVDGMKAMKRISGNTIIREAIEKAIILIEQGSSLSNALSKVNIFPPIIIYMVSSGENSGKLDLMLLKASDHLESEFENFTNTFLSLFEPIIVIIMGGIVATIVLSILLPILKLNTFVLI